MTVHLLNARVFPQAGFYQIDQIDVHTFVKNVREADADGTLTHYIGYDNTLDVIEALTGLDLGGTNVQQTELRAGDVLLYASLHRRVAPGEKIRNRRDGDALVVEDFDFWRGKWTRTCP